MYVYKYIKYLCSARSGDDLKMLLKLNSWFNQSFLSQNISKSYGNGLVRMKFLKQNAFLSYIHPKFSSYFCTDLYISKMALRKVDLHLLVELLHVWKLSNIQGVIRAAYYKIQKKKKEEFKPLPKLQWPKKWSYFLH